MNKLFQQTSSHWVKYSEYEYKQSEDGTLYLTPAPKAIPTVYDPLKDANNLVVDMINVGMLCMKRASYEQIKAAILQFANKYGLLGFITALPTTPEFMDYDAVYLPKNHFIKAESTSNEEYLTYFFPFEKLNLNKSGKKSVWSVRKDRAIMALAMTFGEKPQALSMSFQPEYAERYDWLETQFKDWAFTFVSSILYYEDYERLDEPTRDLYRQGMAAFGGIAPTYHIILLDKPTIVWDFHSLLLGVQMMFGFLLTDEKKSLRFCRHCTKVFFAQHPKTVFCSPQCKNQYNVYKSREKNKGE